MSSGERRVSLVFGILLLAMGVLGFMFGGKSMSNETLLIFQVNLAQNVMRAAFGVWGLVSSASQKMSEMFTQFVGSAHLFLCLLGFFVPNGFGKLPIGGHNIWLHALLGLALLYAGWGKRSVPDDDLLIVA